MITVYTKSACPFCVQAKKLLDVNDLSYREVNIEEDDEAREFILEQGHKTVPQLYKDGELFVEGGHDGLVKYLAEKNTQTTLGELSL